MGLYYFKNITKNHSYLGGKGYTLGLLKNAGFNVPDGLILTEVPQEDSEWSEIFDWWKSHSFPKIAIRSSAVGEDSSEQSFAGQNSTYLNIQSEKEIKTAVNKCFMSMYRSSSTLYREHFLKEKNSEAKMNVVLQVMVDPLFSGVFFSKDPRNNESGWIVEAIRGLGEDLVSGKKNPYHFEEKSKTTTDLFDLKELITCGVGVKNFLGFEIDMEWAIDKDHQLKVLQARPITALSGKSEKKRLIENEIKRLKNNYSPETLWDGGTFAEWSGPPSELTFSIWSLAFAKDHAFSKALKKLGYLGINSSLSNENHSLLERIFNLAYINISMLAPLYFGPIPYRLELKKTPKLKFDLKKMNLITLFLTPITIWRMVKVAFGLSTKRHLWLKESELELDRLKQDSLSFNDRTSYSLLKNEELINKLRNEAEKFYDQTLVWPLILITLIETTTQNLKAMLKGVVTEDQIDQRLNKWLSSGLHTVTMDMNNEYKKATQDLLDHKSFLQKYGHRAPGELELSHPRWIELAEAAFIKSSSQNQIQNKAEEIDSVKQDIDQLVTYKKQIIEKEWLLLKEMLEQREKWKMQILLPYSHIRFIILEIAKRHQLEDLIFWFTLDEILAQNFDLSLAKSRKANCEMSKSIYLPAILQLNELEDILSDKKEIKSKIVSGIALSPGVVFGEVRIVNDPEHVNTDSWPLNTILIAESTDPGWTGLFLKSKAIVVEKGGVLSHCAIVAREMNLPAISGIKQCHLRFKDGDKIWVDGNNGRISLA